MATMTGMFRIALLPSADEGAFASRMMDVFKKADALQLTRITSGFTHSLLKKRSSDVREYVWEARVELVTDHPYDFAENLERVQKSVEGFGVVSGLDIYSNVEG